MRKINDKTDVSPSKTAERQKMLEDGLRDIDDKAKMISSRDGKMLKALTGQYTRLFILLS